MAETYSLPSFAFRSVMSVTHFSRGFSAEKSRFSRSSDKNPAGSPSEPDSTGRFFLSFRRRPSFAQQTSFDVPC
jgi:hypothetical protein